MLSGSSNPLNVKLEYYWSNRHLGIQDGHHRPLPYILFILISKFICVIQP